MIKINPSILSADFNILGSNISDVEKTNATMLHLDVMDGTFVPNISFGIPVISSIRKQSKLFFDAHLMIINPIKYVEKFAQAGSDSITFHYEACSNPCDVIKEIEQTGKKIGIAISPDTSFDVLIKFFDHLDSITIMTVYPGFGGQKFMDNQLSKISRAYEYMKSTGKEIDIQVDGGINKETIKLCASSGANSFIAGSSVFNGNIINNINVLEKAATECYRGYNE